MRGKKWKWIKKMVVNTVSTKEIEEVLEGFLVTGPSTWPDQSCRFWTGNSGK